MLQWAGYPQFDYDVYTYASGPVPHAKLDAKIIVVPQSCEYNLAARHIAKTKAEAGRMYRRE